MATYIAPVLCHGTCQQKLPSFGAGLVPKSNGMHRGRRKREQITHKAQTLVPMCMASLNTDTRSRKSEMLLLSKKNRRRKEHGFNVVRATSPEEMENKPQDPFATKEEYSDRDPISRFMISYFSKVMSKQLNDYPYDGTYEGFVELSRQIMRGRSTKEQQETVAGVLGGLLPPQSPERFRQWFPLNRRNAEFNAWITTLGFGWLVGPSELQKVDVEFEGRTETWNSGVHIKKCRYLENSGCVGMCVNMCKIPTQKFFTDNFGLPLTMNPNFETLECEMIFGQEPPPIEEDPVYNQPCLSPCKIGSLGENGKFQPCPKIDTDRKLN